MNRSWVRFPQAAQIRPPGSGWAFLYACLLLVAPRVFRATRGLFGPGCLVCPWAAARPRAVRAASFARRVVSKPGQAPPPPTGTAAWPSGPSGALHTSGAGSLMLLGASTRCPARPRHRPRAPQPGSPDPQCGLACRAGILGRSAVCCYKRRQSDGFLLKIKVFGCRLTTFVT